MKVAECIATKLTSIQEAVSNGSEKRKRYTSEVTRYSRDSSSLALISAPTAKRAHLYCPISVGGIARVCRTRTDPRFQILSLSFYSFLLSCVFVSVNFNSRSYFLHFLFSLLKFSSPPSPAPPPTSVSLALKRMTYVCIPQLFANCSRSRREFFNS
jgi:hypothetical protein